MIKKFLIGSVVLGSVFAGGCINQNLTPSQQLVQIENNVKDGAALSVDIGIGAEKNATTRTNSAKLLNTVAQSATLAVQNGLTLDQLKPFILAEIAKSGDVQNQAEATQVVNLVFDLIQNNVNVSLGVPTTQPDFQQALVLSALSGIQQGCAPYLVPDPISGVVRTLGVKVK